MKHLLNYISVPLILISVFSCKQDDIDVYSMSNSAIVFNATSCSFSLKGVDSPEVTFHVPVTLIGPVADYDRPISFKVRPRDDDNAQEGVDFRVVNPVLKAGEMTTSIDVEVRNLDEGIEQMSTVLELQPNDYFIAGKPAYSISRILWSKQYVRPTYYVWKDWYNFFCNGYSRNLHEVIVTVLGVEVEHYVSMMHYTKEDPSLTFKSPFWWFGASRMLREYVDKYDKEHPDAPLMHSEDYEFYPSFNYAVGEGKKPETPPTILSTLNVV